jgi:hypothetical protein
VWVSKDKQVIGEWSGNMRSVGFDSITAIEMMLEDEAARGSVD